MRSCKNIMAKILMYISAGITCGILILIIGFVLKKGVPEINLNLLTTKPSYLSGNIGILPDILNTIYLLVTTIVILLPIGTGAAIYLCEYATNQKVVKLINYAAEILSGIPSVIYGLVGMYFFCRMLGYGTCIFAGALTLVVMNLPTVMRTTRESLLSVPKGLKEGAYGLGATKSRVIRTIVIPECLDGIITGCILSAGRILGESAALLFTAGFAHTLNNFSEGIYSSGATLTVALYVYGKEQGEFEIAFAIAVILLILAFIVNISAMGVNAFFKRKRKVV